MKKILPRLALLAAPFLVYFALFFAVKGGASSEDSVITRVRAYLSAPEDAIILGDSRMAHFDMNAVAEASGRGWSNLAFGGASLNESIDLFYLAAENKAFLKRLNHGSVSRLVASLYDSKAISDQDLEELAAFIAQKTKEGT